MQPSDKAILYKIKADKMCPVSYTHLFFSICLSMWNSLSYFREYTKKVDFAQEGKQIAERKSNSSQPVKGYRRSNEATYKILTSMAVKFFKVRWLSLIHI